MTIAFLASLLSTAAQTPATAPSVEPAAARGSDTWVEWLRGGHYWLGARLRYERVDQDGFRREAHAATLRTVLGMRTRECLGFSGTLEFEDVTALFDEDYDSTVNGNTRYPVVLDPEGAEINQAFLEHAREGEWDARVGRQRIVFDNHRFVGNVGWRQNEQTFDALLFTARNLGGIEATYAYVDNVNRVSGEDSPLGDLPSRTHLAHLSRAVGAAGKLSAYAYLLDSERFAATSTNSFGARLAGKHEAGSRWSAQWTAEAAYQVDAGDNPNDVEEPYFLGELGASVGPVSLLLGNEFLGGSGQASGAYQTPLATLHAFNGWADKFLTTPDAGLDDRYVSLEMRAGQGKGQVTWHDFHADHGDAHYGSELDLSVSYAPRSELQIGVKYARYDAVDFATDTEKAWAWMSLAL